jgi:molybdate transport system regulatory protein
MNSIPGQIKSIQTSGELSLVTIDNGGIELTAIVIDTPESAPYLKAGTSVNMLFKETEVILSTENIANISLQNRFSGSIRDIHQGELLSKVTIDIPSGSVTSVITTVALNELKLSEGHDVTCMIKTNEIMLSS